MNHSNAMAHGASRNTLPLYMAVPLPCDPPRRPGAGNADRRRRQRGENEWALRFPGMPGADRMSERLPVMEPGTC